MKKVKPKYYTKIGSMPWGVCEYPREPVEGETVTIVDECRKRYMVKISKTLFDIGRICVEFV